MWKKRAETTWERGVVVKLISKTSSCIRPIFVQNRAINPRSLEKKVTQKLEGRGEGGSIRPIRPIDMDT